MTPIEVRYEALRFRRIQTLGTDSPRCGTCGERRLWVRYENHHIAGRKYSSLTICLCINCHNEISTMQKLLPLLDDCPDPKRAKLIAMHEGHALLLELAAAAQRDTAEMLHGLPTIIPRADSEA